MQNNYMSYNDYEAKELTKLMLDKDFYSKKKCNEISKENNYLSKNGNKPKKQ